ncbi:hypothetical protein GOP47_0019448 [Adiantum capillus-veneris]|uniref:Vacuolar protein sorting-associated protein 26 n=1 Tax=Adiantum capillus-veneris TaxID=13818 RepID=A0A9D4UB22_ADICA|nr:hypothetical protein GOP47_0019448 [Adiantum capillus-veneris]
MLNTAIFEVFRDNICQWGASPRAYEHYHVLEGKKKKQTNNKTKIKWDGPEWQNELSCQAHRACPVTFSSIPSLKSAMNFLRGALAPPCTVTIDFADADNRQQVNVRKENGQMVTVPLFHNLESLAGQVRVVPHPGKRIEHQGIKLELLGQIEIGFDREKSSDFTSLVKELDNPGEIFSIKNYSFDFPNVEMQYESYVGLNVVLRYVLKLTISRAFGLSIIVYKDFWVRNPSPAPEINNSIKMEVGIEDCLHIEFEFSKSKYHLKDVIIGKIYFLLVRIKIKHMELEIRRRESTGSGANTFHQSETLAKYEIMDGAPVRGESIPIRLFLSPYELTPTYKTVNNKFSVHYFLNLVLIDEEGRRYFKQHEITTYRSDAIETKRT